jgi:hypothetical protein
MAKQLKRGNMSENSEKQIQVGLMLDEIDFLEALIDEEEYRIETMYEDCDPDNYPHIKTIRDKFFNARLHLKHKSL